MKCSLPWLTKACIEAIAGKHAAKGTPHYDIMAKKSQEIMRSEYENYMCKLKATMEALPRGSKQ